MRASLCRFFRMANTYLFIGRHKYWLMTDYSDIDAYNDEGNYPTRVTDGDLAAGAFQYDADLLLWGVLAPGSSLDCADEGSGLARALRGGRCPACFCQGHLNSSS